MTVSLPCDDGGLQAMQISIKSELYFTGHLTVVES